MKENNTKVNAFLQAISIVDGTTGDENDAKELNDANTAEYGNLW